MKKSFKSAGQKSFIVFGINAIDSLLDKRPELIYELNIIGRSSNERIASIKKRTINIGLNFIECTKDTLDKISKQSRHQGVVARIKSPSFKNFFDLKYDLENLNECETFLILDSIEDSGNLGAAIRTAHAAGIKAIILTKYGSAKINEYVFKSSVGSIFNVDLYIVSSLSQTINILKNSGFWIIGLSEKSNQIIYDYNFDKKIAIVMGSEYRGMKQLTSSNCDSILSIPMKSSIDSLNVSVALGVVAFEVNRQRNNS
jgi:23S rRNA (guanosine2251-2'-O)-methyltransferase